MRRQNKTHMHFIPPTRLLLLLKMNISLYRWTHYF